jgi:hypothetical protein
MPSCIPSSSPVATGSEDVAVERPRPAWSSVTMTSNGAGASAGGLHRAAAQEYAASCELPVRNQLAGFVPSGRPNPAESYALVLRAEVETRGRRSPSNRICR